MNKQLGIILGLAVLLLIAGFLYVGNTQETKPANQNITQDTYPTKIPNMSPEATNSGSQTTRMEDVKIVEVEAGSFYFKPNEIRVKKGQKVKIVMKSMSMM